MMLGSAAAAKPTIWLPAHTSWYLVSGIWYIAQAQSLIRLSMGIVLRANWGEKAQEGKRDTSGTTVLYTKD